MARSRADSSDADATIYGGPTKRFFVSMLTRDIELSDAILDLIDNSVDGAMRQRRGHLTVDKPFSGFRAELKLSESEFKIWDNCGGIPSDYVDDAFSLGRPNIKKDGDLPTIGMYGIGMKRAIFKIGNEATVSSNSADGHFSVSYTSRWLDPENDDWDLPIKRTAKQSGNNGVEIHVGKLKADISRHFENRAFLNTLKDEISEHFGYLMQRGFRILLNGEELKPQTLVLFNTAHSKSASIRAFDFESDYEEVLVKVTIGFFRPLAKEAEIDEETEGPKETETAGISVVCNDRVILLYDRSMKTGWGDGGVPRYHPQFRAIAGLIVFSSNNAAKLPISTTKRGLDVGSDVYLLARKAAIEGLKLFTDFTNKWKGMEDETSPYFQAAKRSDVKNSIKSASQHGAPVRGSSGSKKYVPNLPMPSNKNPRTRVSFVRDKGQVETLSKFFFDDPSQHPSLVGSEAFDRALKQASKK